MHRDTPKQAFAAREAHEALLELKQLMEEATTLGVGGDEYNEVRLTLETIVARLQSPDFDAKLSRARQTLVAPRGGSVERVQGGPPHPH